MLASVDMPGISAIIVGLEVHLKWLSKCFLFNQNIFFYEWSLLYLTTENTVSVFLAMMNNFQIMAAYIILPS